jgi:hypothetical protein
MRRILTVASAFILLVSVTTVPRSPAVPFIDGCTLASINLAAAQYNLNQCLSGYGGLIPVWSCETEIAQVANAENQFDHWCNINQS